jgi:hypothetical protein
MCKVWIDIRFRYFIKCGFQSMELRETHLLTAVQLDLQFGIVPESAKKCGNYQ